MRPVYTDQAENVTKTGLAERVLGQSRRFVGPSVEALRPDLTAARVEADDCGNRPWRDCRHAVDVVHDRSLRRQRPISRAEGDRCDVIRGERPRRRELFSLPPLIRETLHAMPYALEFADEF